MRMTGIRRQARWVAIRSTRRGSITIRLAALTYVALGLGFGVGSAVTLSHYARHGELPMTPWGFRSLSGPFEELGPERFTRLGWALVATCALDTLAGRWLWQGRRRGARLGLATTPAALVLGLGFALPFLLLGIPLRLALVAAGRRTLR
jgi:hypothetical protein